jgi:hypothetical protein
MAFSPSNSGILRLIGDEVAFDRNPAHDAVGVQLHGDASGVELSFDGIMIGTDRIPLSAKMLLDEIPRERSGAYALVIPALHYRHVRVRLHAIEAGELHVALYSGVAAAFEAATSAFKAAQAAQAAGSRAGNVCSLRGTAPAAAPVASPRSGSSKKSASLIDKDSVVIE